MPSATKELRVIKVQVDAPQVKAALDSIAAGFGKINKSVQQTNQILTSFQSLTSKIGGASLFGFGVKELTVIADGIQLTRDRITALLGPSEDTAAVFNKLAKVADETRTGFAETGETFARVAVSTKALGLSAIAMLSITSVLNKSFLLSGSTAAEAGASTIQFAQALSFGQLRGQELRSVLSQNAVLAGVFREAIKGTGQDIYKFAEAGGFTTKFVLKAMAENFERISRETDKLGRTFEQSLTLGMNKFKLALDELNRSAGLSSGFAKFVDFILEKTPQVITLLGVLAVSTIPALSRAIVALGVTIIANPWIAALYAVGATLTYLAFQVDDFGLKFQKAMETVRLKANEAQIALLEMARAATPSGPAFSAFSDKLTVSLGKNQQEAKNAAASIEYLNDKIIKNEALRIAGPAKKDYAAEAKKFTDEVSKLSEKDKELKLQIGDLNKAFNKGTVEVANYNEQITKLRTKQIEFQKDKGEITLPEYNEKIAQLEFENVVRLGEAGKASFQEIEAARKEFKIEELTRKFKEGKMEVREYNIEVAKLGRSFGERLYVSLQEYVQRTGDLFQGLSGGVVMAFGHMEDTLVAFTETGKFNFKKFADDVISDLNRIIIRSLILRPIADALIGGVSAPSGSGGGGFSEGSSGGSQMSANVNAKGNAYYSGQLQAFASGGVISQPTYFGHSGNKRGLMGEAGSEAIMPLRRLGNGDLGVQAGGGVTVNIINQSGNEVQTSESTDSNGERTVDILISSSVKKSLDSGSFDRTFSQLYGLKRKGT